MVVLHVKAAWPSPSPEGEEEEVAEMEFLYECAAAASVADVAAALGALAGLQAHLLALCRRLRGRCAVAAGELERALDETEAYTSKDQVQHNKFLSPRALREHMKNIEKKCATALPESEGPCLQQSSSVPENKNEKIKLLWAGKELAMDQKLSDYIGVNDKTKIVIRLTQVSDER
ncbi:hypothetical protein ACP4OV_015848 [Aristida adscensionis]